MHLRLEGLSYRTGGRCLIDSIDLQSAAQRCTALLGENGAGKSLLLYLCHGLLNPSAGTVLWNARPPTAWRGAITMVFQKPVLLRRSAYKNIEHALALQGVPKAKRRRRAMAALEQVGMAGQQQRLAIARALALRPAVILMDEPTSDLDIHSATAVEGIIKNMCRSGIKIIIATHNLAQVRRLCDEVLFMDRGRLLCHSAADDFFTQPTEKKICTFIESCERAAHRAGFYDFYRQLRLIRSSAPSIYCTDWHRGRGGCGRHWAGDQNCRAGRCRLIDSARRRIGIGLCRRRLQQRPSYLYV